MLSRGELRGKVLRFLNKTPDLPGFYSPEKVNDAIDESLNYIAVEMFLAGEGWFTKYLYFDTEGGTTSVDLPGNVALIREVRYSVGGVYTPMGYNDLETGNSYIGTGIQQAFSYWYRLLGKQMVFDPPLSEGGDRFLQLEVVYYPQVLLNDSEMIDPQFDAACCQFLVYKVCSILAASIEKEVIPWAAQEAGWEEKMRDVTNRRILSSTPIREFL